MKGGARIEVFRHLFTAIAEEMQAQPMKAAKRSILKRLKMFVGGSS